MREPQLQIHATETDPPPPTPSRRDPAIRQPFVPPQELPRAGGDREALRILLVARQEMAVACTAQAGRLRALLLAGDDADRLAARAVLTQMNQQVRRDESPKAHKFPS